VERALYHHYMIVARLLSTILSFWRASILGLGFLPSSHFTVLEVRSLGSIVDSWGIAVAFGTNPFCMH